MVRDGQFAAFRVVQGHHGLEPAGDGIGQVGDQAARLRLDDELLSAPRAKTEAVHCAGQDLPVHEPRRQASSGRRAGA